ncbi:hypothetical protein [Paramesorhizobium deserti]|nr:hypothetical protein [Paramesorhizobium deserti]
MKQFLRFLSFTPSLAGILLQGYISFVLPEGRFDVSFVWLFLYSCLPYAICCAVAAKANSPAGFFGALAALINDAVTFHDVFIAPTHSTAPIGLLLAPLANLILFMPVGLIVGWVTDHAVHAYRARDKTPAMKS